MKELVFYYGKTSRVFYFKDFQRVALEGGASAPSAPLNSPLIYIAIYVVTCEECKLHTFHCKLWDAIFNLKNIIALAKETIYST